MHRTRLIRVLGIFLAGCVAMSIGYRPPVRAGLTPTAVAVASVGGAFGGGSDEETHNRAPVVHLAAKPMSVEATKTWLKLQEKVAVHFPDDTTLADYKKFLEEVTADKNDPASGIAIYFDPLGLQDIEKTMTSATFTFDMKAVPLATSMELILAQLQLHYRVQKDGIVYITTVKSDDPSNLEELIFDTLAALKAEVRALREDLRHARSSGSAGAGMATEPEPNRIMPNMSGSGGMR